MSGVSYLQPVGNMLEFLTCNCHFLIGIGLFYFHPLDLPASSLRRAAINVPKPSWIRKKAAIPVGKVPCPASPRYAANQCLQVNHNIGKQEESRSRQSLHRQDGIWTKPPLYCKCIKSDKPLSASIHVWVIYTYNLNIYDSLCTYEANNDLITTEKTVNVNPHKLR